MRTVAVTGATGFVGTETLEQLLSAGFSVRALARRPQAERAGVAWIMGGLDDAAALDALVTGADVVLHIAGVVNAPDRAGFEAGNGTGTANVIAAMERAEPKRLIHVSSFAARQPELSDYCWSKALAEKKVLGSGLDWTMVRPPAVYGPRDTEFIEVMKVARYGIMPVPPKGRASLIHVADLAAVLVSLCGETGDDFANETWEVDDGAPGGLSHIELAATFGRALKRRVIPLPLPQPLLMLFAHIDRMLRGPAAKLTKDRVRYMCHPDWVIDPAKRPPSQFWQPRIGADEGLAQVAATLKQ
ncbi:SDR family oxidoreductase [Sphingobium fluviale]|uniref:NAD-dependent epimerase/dehydratase family protein n=1 Tax=Sphingobium fluviale TaxID=2506423 RepID=A0A4Q1KI72_9SPHN|nr:NAD(P)H-binding protein [Sphingobium fluviale]RXR29005.1 NAD-dependent epimerase/dehydratase family protein [Sphingobium fluviale]